MVVSQGTVNAQWLKQLPDVKGLNDGAISELAATLSIETLPSGRRLFMQGQRDHWAFYLIDGTVALTCPSKPPETVKSGQLVHLLAPEQPRRCTAFTVTSVSFVRIDCELVQKLREKCTQSSRIGAVSTSAVTLDEQIFSQFYQDYTQDRLSLPSLPDIAVRVRKAVQDPNNGPNEIAKLVQADSGLTAQLLQTANSALYAGNGQINSLRQAITRLGMDTTRDITTSFSVKQLFTSNSAVLRKVLFTTWQHAARVAAISHVMARQTPGHDPEQALLAGLVHDIGTLPIVSHAQHYPELLNDPDKLQQLVNKLKPQVGAMVLRKWKFPQAMITTALEAEHWTRNPAEQADLCDIVMIAQIHSHLGTPLFSTLPALDTLPAFNKIAGGQLTPENSMKIIEESKTEIQGMIQLLGG